MLIRSVLVVGVPLGNGGYSFCINLRKALQPFGVRVFGIVAKQSTSRNDAVLSEHGDEILLSYGQDRLGAEALIDFVQTREIDVMIPSNSPLLTSAVPHLPRDTLALPRCNAIVNSAYYFVTRHRAHMPLIAVSSPRQRYDLMVKWGVPSRRIRLVPHGTEVPRRIETIGTEAPTVFVGRLERSKGVHLLPDIIERVLSSNPNFRLEILGDGSYRQCLETELCNRKLADLVTFHGTVARTEVMAALSRAQLFINPTQHDGFGLVTIEAMAHGAVPIVSRIRGVTTAIVQNGRSGFLCPRESATAFGRAVVAAQDNPARLQRVRRAAHDRVRSEFSLSAMALRYLAVIRELKESAEFQRAPPLPLSRYAPYRKYCPSFFAKMVHKIL